MSDPILSVRNVESFYGDARALHGVSLELNAGEMLALIGSNGAGKTTLLKTVCGLIKRFDGDIVFDGNTIGGMVASEIAKLGIALVPEGRRLFPSLSVEEIWFLAEMLDALVHGVWRRSTICSRSSRNAETSHRRRCPAVNNRWSRLGAL